MRVYYTLYSQLKRDVVTSSIERRSGLSILPSIVDEGGGMKTKEKDPVGGLENPLWPATDSTTLVFGQRKKRHKRRLIVEITRDSGSLSYDLFDLHEILSINFCRN